MNHELICPFREQTASRRLFMAIARSERPLTKSEIARAAHLTAAKTATLLAAYLNPMHKAPLDRIGVRLVRTKEGSYTLESCRPKPNAKRPARGVPTPAKNAKKTPARAKADEGKDKKPLRKKRTKPATAIAEVQPDSPPPMVSEAPLPSEHTN